MNLPWHMISIMNNTVVSYIYDDLYLTSNSCLAHLTFQDARRMHCMSFVINIIMLV